MSETVVLSPENARALVATALVACDTSPQNAESVARALVAAEVDGQRGHGLSRVPSYAAQVRSGKVDGHAVPTLERPRSGLLRLDAAHGFAYPAVDRVIEAMPAVARENGVAAAAIRRSHHFGQAGAHVERLAEAGLVALTFANSPKAMAPWGGREAVFGTNPIAFACPSGQDAPLVIDLSLSKVARGKVMAAKQAGEPIPEGWALDADGAATTDPAAALAGTMVPMGDAKGAALALMVELLAAALVGAHFASEASSFFEADGPPPGVGQLILAIDPEASAGDGFAGRVSALLGAIKAQDGARVPGTRRLETRAAAARDGLTVPAKLYAEIVALAGTG